MFKKTILSFALAIFVFISTSTPFLVAKANAQSTETWYNQGFQSWFVKVYDASTPPSEIFGERYTAAQVQWVIYGLGAFVINLLLGQNAACATAVMSGNLTQCITALLTSTNTPSTLAEKPNEKASLLTLVFQDQNRPVSGINYSKSLVSRSPFVKEANAQGFGFTHLGQLRQMWVATRDIAYTLLVLIIIVYAFMIMFRVKLSPQTVISVQVALPKVIFSIIFITFSYAIAGFMIDLVYVVIGLVSVLFAQSHLVTGAADVYRFMTVGGHADDQGIGAMLHLYTTINFITFNRAMMELGNVTTGWAAGFTIGIASFVLDVVVSFVLLFVFFKTVWLFIKTLVTIYLLIMFAPLYILAGNISGSLGFGSWLKALVSNLAVFPLAGIFLTLSYIFLLFSASLTGASDGLSWGENMIQIMQRWGVTAFQFFPANTSPGWAAPLLPNEMMPLTMAIASLGILTLLPKLADMIKSMITGREFTYGTAINEAMSAGAGYALGSARTAAGAPGAAISASRSYFQTRKVFEDAGYHPPSISSILKRKKSKPTDVLPV